MATPAANCTDVARYCSMVPVLRLCDQSPHDRWCCMSCTYSLKLIGPILPEAAAGDEKGWVIFWIGRTRSHRPIKSVFDKNAYDASRLRTWT